MKKIVLLAAVAALFVSMLAVPATAHTGAGVLQGTAKVSPSLGLPPSGVTGTWDLSGTVTGADSGTLSVQGDLGPNDAGVGASCGMSKGENGEGTFTAASGVHGIHNVTWPSSGGGTIVAVGDWDHNGATGIVLATVQAQGGADKCLAGEADEFAVVGTAELI